MRVKITTEDGAGLVGEWREAAAPRAVAIIHSAAGVPAGYYAAFADWLMAERHVHVLIYDYRDMGWSAEGPVSRSRATMADWGVTDQSAMLDHAIARFPDLPVWIIGHSMGGFCLPFHAQADRVTRHIAIASGPAYWPTHPFSFMPVVIAFWFLVGPIATQVCGYLPGKSFGFNADLPAGVFWQWRRWCTDRRFYRPDYGGVLPWPEPERIVAKVELIGFSDDPMMPSARVARLADYYPRARTSFREIDPQDVGLAKIGHIGAFARRNAALWPHLVRDDG
ncbi:alpha/beta fold hydrolase [Roseobacter sp. HKCCA0434]|uniref:alpha/beta hydrolase family protein n=1 Tax=Roseobacter sp. HKCCA0434 TaxID=3079297 RepID=UPI0029058BBD|nr:alpha/beta fold hydrolase [Roseobacter sp. HKCCA0434]